MFDDKRSKKIILLAHCLLNQNSISDGTADFPSQFKEIIELLMANDVGILQLPCPELTCLGLDRSDKEGGRRELLAENTRIRTLMSQEANLDILKKRAEEIVRQVGEYRLNGFHVLGIVGINRSPSCGVETTTIDSREVGGQGIFMQLLSEDLRQAGYGMPIIGVKTSEKEYSIEGIESLIRESIK